MPVKVKRRSIFYGWWIVGASFFIGLYIGGTLYYGFTAFLDPIVDDMGWSYTQVSLAVSLRGLEMGLLAPLVGILADRWGPRRIMFISVFFNVAGLFVLSVTHSLTMFFVAFALIATGVSANTFHALSIAVANWFRRKIGIAVGIAICGYGLSGLMAPLIVRLIDIYEWRMTSIILALGLLGIILPLSLFFRHKPEQYGYFPDGQSEDSATFNNIDNSLPAIEVSMTVKQVLKSGTFWRLVLLFSCHAIVMNTVITHVMPYLSSVGVNRLTSSLVVSAISLASIAGRLGLGWMGDKIDKRFVSTAAFSMVGFGLLFFGYVSTGGYWLLVPFFILYGIGYGGINVLSASMIREYFGRSNYGTIFGFIMGISAIGGLAGPTMAGWVYDNWGSYQVFWYVLAALSILAIMAILSIPRYVRTPPINLAGDSQGRY